MSEAQLMLQDCFPVNKVLHFTGQRVERFNQGLYQLGRLHVHGHGREWPAWLTLVLLFLKIKTSKGLS